jgi:hypothetical protein
MDNGGVSDEDIFRFLEKCENHVLGVFIQPVFFATRIIGVHLFFRGFFKNNLTFIRGEGPNISIV